MSKFQKLFKAVTAGIQTWKYCDFCKILGFLVFTVLFLPTIPGKYPKEFLPGICHG